MEALARCVNRHAGAGGVNRGMARDREFEFAAGQGRLPASSGRQRVIGQCDPKSAKIVKSPLLGREIANRLDYFTLIFRR